MLLREAGHVRALVVALSLAVLTVAGSSGRLSASVPQPSHPATQRLHPSASAGIHVADGANGDTVTLGLPLPLSTAPNGIGCLPPSCAFVNATFPPGMVAQAPADGTITEWHVEEFDGAARLVVAKADTGGKYSIVAESARATAPCVPDGGGCAPASGKVYTFETKLPVAAGELIGIEEIVPAICKQSPFDPSCPTVGTWCPIPGQPTCTATSEELIPMPPLDTPTTPAGQNVGFVVTVNADEQADPTVAGVLPAEGADTGDTRIKVAGDFFQGATKVDFQLPDGKEVPAKSFSCRLTSCSVVTPDISMDISAAGRPGPVAAAAGPGEVMANVRVTTSNGTSILTKLDRFLFSPLTVTFVASSPGSNEGPLDQSPHGSNRAPDILVRGSGFEKGATRVSFEAQGAPHFTVHPAAVRWDSNQQLTVTLGKDVADLLPRNSNEADYPTDVVASEGNISSPKNLEDVYDFMPPSVQRLGLHELPLDVVKNLTVSGDYFRGATALVWTCASGAKKGNRAFHYNIASPIGGAAIEHKLSRMDQDLDECGPTDQDRYLFDVRVEVGNGVLSPPVSPDEFTYLGPHVDSATAASDRQPFIGAGIPIAIKGSAFDKATSACFLIENGTGPCPDVSNPGPNRISLNAPTDLGDALTGPRLPLRRRSYAFHLTVHVGDADSANGPSARPAIDFLGPQVTGLDPASGSLDGGKKLTITGVGFQGATQVWFRLAKDPSRFARLAVPAKASVAAGGRSITIPKMPDLASILPSTSHGTYTFEVAVDVGHAEDPANAPLDQYRAKG